MVAPRFPLHVVFWPTDSPSAPASRIARSRDLVPGADPYIALLIRRLQDEVRDERAMRRLNETSCSPLHAESAPPSLDEPLEFEFPESPSWSYDDPPPSQPR